MPNRNQNNRGGRNNNPEGRNQYSGWTDSARERPVAAAAAAAAVVGAGVFLWSRRSQISEQLSSISDQIGEWSENRSNSSGAQFETAGASSNFSDSAGTGASGSSSFGGTSPSGSTSGSFSETGGGSASFTAQGGGSSTTSSGGKGSRGRS